MLKRFSRLASATLTLSAVLLCGGLEVLAQKGVKASPLPQKGAAGAAAVARPWTREEMLSAIPLDIVVRNGATVPTATYGDVPRPDGPAGGTAPGLGGINPTGAAQGPAVAAAAGEAQSGVASGTEALDEPYAAYAAFSYPYPFTRYPAFTTDYTTYPYKTVGKVFFKKNGLSYVCSASSIGNYGIITAGHCVHSGNNSPTGWRTDFVFVPGYQNGFAPYGQFTANHLWVTTHWYANGQFSNFSRDVGGAVLNKVTLGGIQYKISQRVGWLGTMWNYSYYQNFHAIGYPQDPPFNGLTMQICSASFARHDAAFLPNTTGIGCDQTGGTSGGPWVVGLRAPSGLNNRVNGVNSYKYTAQPLATYSPYFDTTIGSLINCIINSGPGVQRCAAPAAP